MASSAFIPFRREDSPFRLPSQPPSIRNSAYIHRICALSDLEVIRTDKDISYLRPFDIMSILEGISQRQETIVKSKPPINPGWKYYKLKSFFAKCTSASITLTFKEMERIGGITIPETARKNKQWWYPRKDYNRIAEAWISEGYCMRKLNLPDGKVTFHRRIKTPNSRCSYYSEAAGQCHL